MTEHIERKVISYRGSTCRVVDQGDGIYTIMYQRKEMRVTVDPYSGSVYEAEAGIDFAVSI